MEPIRGGQLARSPPQRIMELWKTAPRSRAPAEWALQWVWNHPEVSVVLSGMSTMDQVKQNVISSERSGVNTLTPEELDLISRVRDTYREICPIPCTQCEYCLPCPHGVNIPRMLRIYNDAMMYNDKVTGRASYQFLKKQESAADKCVQCGDCEEKCPQSIEIRNWLAKVRELFEEEAP